MESRNFEVILLEYLVDLHVEHLNNFKKFKSVVHIRCLN